MEDKVNCDVILRVPGAQIYEINGQRLRLVHSGDFLLLNYTHNNVYLINVGNFRFCLSHEIPIVRGYGVNFVLPDVDGFIGLKFTEELDPELMEIMEHVFNEHADYAVHQIEEAETPDQDVAPEVPVEAKQSVEENKEVREEEDKAGLEENDLEEHLVRPISKTTRLASWIAKGGSKLASGIMKGADWTSEKISNGKTYLTKKIKKKEQPAQVSEQNLVRVARVRTVSNAVFVVSKTVVDGAIAGTAAVAKSVADKFESSKYTQKIVSTSAYKGAKEIGGASISAVASVFQALEEALFTLAKSGGEAAVDVVRHRYGDKAALAANDGMHSALNVVNTARVVKGLGPKSMAKKTAKATATALFEEKKA